MFDGSDDPTHAVESLYQLSDDRCRRSAPTTPSPRMNVASRRRGTASVRPAGPPAGSAAITATFVLLAAAFGYLSRLVRGPSLSERVIALDGLLVSGISAVAVHAMSTGRLVPPRAGGDHARRLREHRGNRPLHRTPGAARRPSWRRRRSARCSAPRCRADPPVGPRHRAVRRRLRADALPHQGLDPGGRPGARWGGPGDAAPERLVVAAPRRLPPGC